MEKRYILGFRYVDECDTTLIMQLVVIEHITTHNRPKYDVHIIPNKEITRTQLDGHKIFLPGYIRKGNNFQNTYSSTDHYNLEKRRLKKMGFELEHPSFVDGRLRFMSDSI